MVRDVISLAKTYLNRYNTATDDVDMDNNELVPQIAALIEQSEQRTAQRISAVDVKIENDVILKSKWGFSGVYQHYVSDGGPYDDSHIEYYRK